MLEETNQLLNEIKEKNKINSIKQAKRKYIINKYKIILKYLLIGLISIAVFIFPIQTGEIIGTWINDFFVTIYKNIIK